MRAGVLITGNLAVDMVVRVAEEIPWGRTALVESIEQHTGGNGCNAASALAALGERVRLLGAVGTDAYGGFVIDRLTGAGVETAYIQRMPGATATTIALVNAEGARGFLHQLGVTAEAYVDPERFTAHLDDFRHYHVAGPFRLTRMRAIFPELLRRARAAGLSTSVDTQWDTVGRWMEDLAPSLPFVDLLLVNEDEARMLCRSANADDAGRVLRAAGAGAVVVKLGERGCALYAGGERIRVPAFTAHVVDTTGAGDCFTAGFLSEMLRGAPLADCARFACGVAGMSVERAGATAAAGTRAAAEAWMRARAIIEP